jgi:hypothetical protein
LMLRVGRNRHVLQDIRGRGAYEQAADTTGA